MKLKVLMGTLLFAFLPLISIAQLDHWEGGIFVGFTGFSGDVNPQTTPDISEITLAFGVSGKVQVNSKIGFKGSLHYARLVGNDMNYEERMDRAFRFNTTALELTGTAEWEPFGSGRYYSNARGDLLMDRLISPYLYTGIGFIFANLETDFSRYPGGNPVVEQGILVDRMAGSSNFHLIIPVGIGFKFDLSETISIALDFGARLSFSDYLDGISEAANPEKTDAYLLGGINFLYRFFN